MCFGYYGTYTAGQLIVVGSPQILNCAKGGGRIWCEYQQPDSKLCFLQRLFKERLAWRGCAQPFGCRNVPEPPGWRSPWRQRCSPAPCPSLSPVFHGQKTRTHGWLQYYPDQGTRIAAGAPKQSLPGTEVQPAVFRAIHQTVCCYNFSQVPLFLRSIDKTLPKPALLETGSLTKRRISFSPSDFLHQALSHAHTLICFYLIYLSGLKSKFT